MGSNLNKQWPRKGVRTGVTHDYLMTDCITDVRGRGLQQVIREKEKPREKNRKNVT